MENKNLEIIIKNSIGIGVIQTLNQLGLINEQVTVSQAVKIYGRKLIEQWRHKRWITGYPTGNTGRGKVYFKRSELETASRMMSIQNSVAEPMLYNFKQFK